MACASPTIASAKNYPWSPESSCLSQFAGRTSRIKKKQKGIIHRDLKPANILVTLITMAYQYPA